MVATRPLTDDEEWIELEKGELLVLDEGLPRKSVRELVQLELLGHGINSTVFPRSALRLQEDLRRYEQQPEFHAGRWI